MARAHCVSSSVHIPTEKEKMRCSGHPESLEKKEIRRRHKANTV